MRTILSTVFLVFQLLLPPVNALAQQKEWKNKSRDKGKIQVSYRITEKQDDTGRNVLLIEDSTTTTISNSSLKRCIALMKDIAKHKEFTGDYRSELLNTLSENDWLVYYYTKNPWPIAYSDCVSKMSLTEKEQEKTAIFDFTAAPTEYQKGNVARMTCYQVRYIFQELADGKVAITMMGKSSPPVKVPVWVVKSAFPGVPARAVRKLSELLKG